MENKFPLEGIIILECEVGLREILFHLLICFSDDMEDIHGNRVNVTL